MKNTFFNALMFPKTIHLILFSLTITFSTHFYCNGQDERSLAFACTETKIIADENDNNKRKWVVLNKCETVGVIANLKIISKIYSEGSEDTTYTIKDTIISYIAPGEILYLKNEECEIVMGNKRKCVYYKKWTSTFK